MLLLRTAFPWILLSILALLSLCSGARDRSRSKTVTRAQRSGTGPSRGRFTLKSGLQCTWSTADTSDGVKMSVRCENPQARVHGGVTHVQCEYKAKPQSCPGYQSNPKAYYKQVSRALKKLQGGLCRDERALVRAGVCKRARQAHFKLDTNTAVFSAQAGIDPTPRPKSSSTTVSTTTRTTTRTTASTAPAPGGTPADCRGRADHREVAEEYCSSSWASVCAFFFSMLQSEDC
ncbi:fibroblast growth factor-binding protein 1-like [Eucyclogobius newberryi]|uniref:fibroblast growth factor-binding protein 1-like n=1 Tax=Eucyclogobius newberryi TaxID=166745 RepID=UPI003B5B13AC